MPYFDNNGIKINYEIEGEGPDLMMIHGFMGSLESNWRIYSWVETLKDENRLIMIDCRGHGKSDKPHDPGQYGSKMADDITKLMDHLSIKRANFFGYSMGSGLTLQILLDTPEYVTSAILGGYALPSESGYEQRRKGSRFQPDTFKTENPDQITDPTSKDFRRAAEAWGFDLNVGAAIMEEGSSRFSRSYSEMKEALGKVSVPVMTVVGSNDNLMPENKTRLCKLIPRACHFELEGRDHISAIPSGRTKMVVKAFLNYVNKT